MFGYLLSLEKPSIFLHTVSSRINFFNTLCQQLLPAQNMLNTNKLLYILSDLAYVVELLPGKKPHDFSIQNFRQINGEFIDGNKLLTDNIKKLIGKIEEGEYNLVLPDILFTNTILNIDAEAESEVKEYLQEKVLPDLHADEESHQIESSILTTYKGSSKVQLSSIQRSMLAPIGNAVDGSDVKINHIYPLTWTIKSLISLEPSISVIQLGSYLYMAKHYIGVDQPTMNELDNPSRIVETVKTLKGAEPSIQTLYLLSNELVEEELKENLSDILPIQQLASHDEEESKMPSYVGKAIVAGMKTISIEDFDVPQFEVEVGEELSEEIDKEEENGQDLPAPSKPSKPKKKEKKEKVKAEVETLETEEDEDKAEEEVEQEKMETQAEEKPTADEEESEQKDDENEDSVETAVPFQKDGEADEDEENVIEDEDEEEVDLEQFVDEERQQEMKAKKKQRKKKIVKNKDGVGSFLKIFFIGLASFAVTVVIGVGIGLGVLKVSQSDPGQIETPVVDQETEISPTAEPSPTPTPTPVIAREDLSIKVVNATTKSGYAGDISDQLDEAGYGQTVAANASGDYEEGFYLLMEEENQALVNLVGEDLELEVDYFDQIKVEDPKGEYDAVLVLAKQ